MTPGEDLFGRIRDAVRQSGVPHDQVDALAEVAARALVAVASTPYYYEQLQVVQQLRQENQLLRAHLANAEAVLRTAARAKRTAAPKKPVKKVAKKRAPAPKKKAAAPKVTGSSAQNRQAFKQGYRGL